MRTLAEMLAGPGTTLMDGAMGTMLLPAGLPAGLPPDVWNVLRPELVLAVHSAWIAVGAEVLVTNTFGAHPERLAACGRDETVGEVADAAVGLAFEAAGRAARVLGDVGPAAAPGAHAGTGAAARAEAYRPLVGELARAGVDGLLVESMRDALELEAALIACRLEAPSLPVLVTATWVASGATGPADPLSPVRVGELAREHGAVAVGANCTELPDPMVAALTELAGTGLPLVARPGILPRTQSEMSPGMWAAGARFLAALPIRMLGGCCGTTPEHVRALAKAVAG